MSNPMKPSVSLVSKEIPSSRECKNGTFCPEPDYVGTESRATIRGGKIAHYVDTCPFLLSPNTKRSNEFILKMECDVEGKCFLLFIRFLLEVLRPPKRKNEEKICCISSMKLFSQVKGVIKDCVVRNRNCSSNAFPLVQSVKIRLAKIDGIEGPWCKANNLMKKYIDKKNVLLVVSV
mmetsp:Transcript_196/g.298  ORF Transcript_196/g.298 Transcript_196/m.298 type:complete len:177 (-) Transcript_196:863-1393(-)